VLVSSFLTETLKYEGIELGIGAFDEAGLSVGLVAAQDQGSRVLDGSSWTSSAPCN
jgi:hypothetical protein